jgi:8-oxo-dGTP pyrophosphatase MutT (NUDIX family)
MPRLVTCGVVITDGRRVLLGHATRSPRWDIPKGVAEPGEDYAATAARELEEETSLLVPASSFTPLGVHAYRPGKDLALFAWMPEELPDPTRLVCRSTFHTTRGDELPEFDRFGLFAWEDALQRVGRSMVDVLRRISPAQGWR